MSISVSRQAVLAVFSKNKCMVLPGGENHHRIRWLLRQQQPRLDPFHFSGLGERAPPEPDRTKATELGVHARYPIGLLVCFRSIWRNWASNYCPDRTSILPRREKTIRLTKD